MLWQKIIIDNKATLGIWQITETVDQLTAILTNKDWTDKVMSIKSETKKLEKLAVRALLKELTGEEKEISYTSAGKPYFKDGLYHISISHTKGYAAVIISAQYIVGIDIEQISDKVKRVRNRFISDEEYISSSEELNHLLLHWSAKETVYKMLDKPGIELKTAVRIAKFLTDKEGSFKAQIIPMDKGLIINYFIATEFVLTYSISDN